MLKTSRRSPSATSPSPPSRPLRSPLVRVRPDRRGRHRHRRRRRPPRLGVRGARRRRVHARRDGDRRRRHPDRSRTDTPAYEPWFVDNDPTNGKGYESAVAYAIAEQLGYTAGPGRLGDRALQQGRPARARRTSTSTSTRSPSPRPAARPSTSPPATTTSCQTVITNKGSAIDGVTSRRRPRRRQARRPGRHHQLHRDHRPDPALAGPGRLRHQRPGGAGAQERPDRRHRRRPARPPTT